MLRARQPHITSTAVKHDSPTHDNQQLHSTHNCNNTWHEHATHTTTRPATTPTHSHPEHTNTQHRRAVVKKKNYNTTSMRTQQPSTDIPTHRHSPTTINCASHAEPHVASTALSTNFTLCGYTPCLDTLCDHNFGTHTIHNFDSRQARNKTPPTCHQSVGHTHVRQHHTYMQLTGNPQQS